MSYRIHQMLLLFALFCFEGVFASPPEEFSALNECLGRLKATGEKYADKIPAPLLSLDRKLKRMWEGIAFLEENRNLLRERYAGRVLRREERHLIANAVEGCRAYTAAFEKGIRIFALFSVCIAGLILVLTLRAFFTILRPAKTNARDRHESSIHPSRSAHPNHSTPHGK